MSNINNKCKVIPFKPKQDLINENIHNTELYKQSVITAPGLLNILREIIGGTVECGSDHTLIEQGYTKVQPKHSHSKIIDIIEGE